jgi:6-phosphogluconolactonase (cycloisomerase 2 family)
MFVFRVVVASLTSVLVVANLAYAEVEVMPWLVPVEVCTDGIPAGPKEHSTPGLVTLSPDGEWVVSTSRAARIGELLFFRRSRDTGRLKLAHSIQSAGGEPAFTSDSRFAYVSVGAMALAVYKISEGGPMTVPQQRLREGTAGIVGMTGVHPLLISPDNRHVYVASYQDQTLVCFERDLESGILTFRECYQDDSAGLPRASGLPSIARLVPTATKIDGVGMIGCLAITPDGKQVMTGVVEGDRLAILDRDVETGRLTLSTTVSEEPNRFGNGVKGVRSIAFAGRGKFLVTASVTGGVSLFTRDPALRDPIFEWVYFGDIPGLNEDPSVPKLKVVKGLINPVAVAFLPNESGLIVAGAREHALHAFRFDPKVPELRWVGSVKDGENGITGLHKVRDLAISPDGRFLYVASGNATVAVFEIKLP